MATSQDFVTWSCNDALFPDYLLKALLAEGVDIKRFGEGSTHTTIYFPEVKAFHIALPPQAEQRRIVAKIDRLPKKTAKIHTGMSQKPLLPILRQIIEDSRDILGKLAFLETEQGNAFTPAGFGNWFRDRCDEAGLPQCTAHGLKKAGATIAAKNGATNWGTVRMAEVYTRAAEQKRLAGEAMFLISLDRKENENCRTGEPRVVALQKNDA